MISRATTIPKISSSKRHGVLRLSTVAVTGASRSVGAGCASMASAMHCSRSPVTSIRMPALYIDRAVVNGKRFKGAGAFRSSPVVGSALIAVFAGRYTDFATKQLCEMTRARVADLESHIDDGLVRLAKQSPSLIHSHADQEV